MSRITDKIKEIKDSLSRVYDKTVEAVNFVRDEDNKEAVKLIFSKLKLLIKHYFPRKLTGNAVIGFDDPATTGEVLGAFYALSPGPLRNLNLSGNFTENEISGNIKIKGHIRLNHAVWAVIRLYMNKTIRKWMQDKEA